MKKKVLLILISKCSLLSSNFYKYDFKYKYNLTVVGFIKSTDGLGRLSFECIDILKNEAKINFIPTRPFNKSDLYEFGDKKVKQIFLNNDYSPGKISILFDAIAYKEIEYYKKVPDSYIKIAYSMLESTAIPKHWVNILNTHFDAVCVPDPFYVQVYKSSGVTIPIFVFPHGIRLNNLFNIPREKKPDNKFIFGCSSVFEKRKNQALLIKAFAEEFGNNPEMLLKIHGRWGKDYYELLNLKNNLGLNNVIIINQIFTKNEYINFLKSLDCYILISKGEGYSLSPREAITLGIPCIITDNTAHRTLCKSQLIKRIPINNPCLAQYELLNLSCGFQFDCDIEEIKSAMRDIKENYQIYQKKAYYAKKWIKQFDYNLLKQLYKTLIKPKKVLLTKRNYIGNGFIETNSELLYRKYLKIINIQK